MKGSMSFSERTGPAVAKAPAAALCASAIAKAFADKMADKSAGKYEIGGEGIAMRWTRKVD